MVMPYRAAAWVSAAKSGGPAGGGGRVRAWAGWPASAANCSNPAAPVQPREQVIVIPADGHAQHAAVVVAGDGRVERADLLIKAFGEASVGVADSDPDLTHQCLLPRDVLQEPA